MWTGNSLVVLPPSQLHILNKPDSELTGFWALIENIQMLHFFDRDVLENMIHFEILPRAGRRVERE